MKNSTAVPKMSENVRFHLEMKAEEYVVAGMTQEEALRAARRQFGNETRMRELSREAWGFVKLEGLLQDVRFSARSLARHKGFTAAAVLTLALGIGANTAVFSVVNSVLMRPLPYTDAERIVVAFEKRPQQNRMKNEVTAAEFFEWRNQAASFESIAANGVDEFTLTGVEASEVLLGRRVSQQFFRVMGRQPVLGRVFTEAEDQPGGDKAALISHALWQRQFGGRPDALGKALLLNSQNYAVVGVMPSDFDPPSEVWVPLALDEAKARAVNNHYLYVTTRLKPGVTQAQAQVEMDAIANRIEQAAPATNKGHGVNLVPLREQLVGSVRPTLWILLGVVGLVLLIACANLASLTLARNTARQRELALRAALGASRARLIRQLLTESLVLSLLGGGMGLLLAVWVGEGVLAKLNGRVPIPRLDEVQVAGQRVYSILLGCFAALALALACFGLYGVMSYNVTQRTHEIGIYMVLGAKSRDTLWLIIRQGMLPVLIGTMLGIAASVVLTRLLSAWLFGLNWADPAMFAGISLLLTVVALLACYIPARRAARVNPTVALRCE